MGCFSTSFASPSTFGELALGSRHGPLLAPASLFVCFFLVSSSLIFLSYAQPTTYDSLPIQADIAATKDELNPEDQTMVEIADIQKLFKEKDVHCSRWFYNLFCFIE